MRSSLRLFDWPACAVGYIEGQNIVIEQRYAAGAYERLPGVVMELVQSNVNVIVVDGTAAWSGFAELTRQYATARYLPAVDHT